MLNTGLLVCAAVLLVLLKPPGRALARVAILSVGCAGIVFVLLGHSREIADAREDTRVAARAPLLQICQEEADNVDEFWQKTPEPPSHDHPDQEREIQWRDLMWEINRTFDSCVGRNSHQCPIEANWNMKDLQRVAHAYRTGGDGCQK